MLQGDSVEFAICKLAGRRQRCRKDGAPKSIPDEFGHPAGVVHAMPDKPGQPASIHDARESLFHAAAEASHERFRIERFQRDAFQLRKPVPVRKRDHEIVAVNQVQIEAFIGVFGRP